MDDDVIVFASKEVGSRAATRVRVDNKTRHTFYQGKRGTIASIVGRTMLVRLDGVPVPLPFGRDELKVINY